MIHWNRVSSELICAQQYDLAFWAEPQMLQEGVGASDEEK